MCVSCLKSAGRSSYGGYSHSPYFYGHSHYYGWGSYHGGGWHHHHSGGHDSGDFTEADGGATEIAGDEGFETDMEGS